jgi:hypothetical protein
MTMLLGKSLYYMLCFDRLVEAVSEADNIETSEYNIKTYLVTLSSDVSILSASDTASTSLSKHSI